MAMAVAVHVVLLRLMFLTISLRFVASQDPVSCGLYNVLTVDGNGTSCKCPAFASLRDPNDPNGDCIPDFTPSCDESESNNGGDTFDFVELTDIDWPGDDYWTLKPSNEQICKDFCLKDCFCGVAIFRSNQCWKKCFPLSNGRVDTTLNVTAFVKIRKEKGPPQSPPVFPEENKDQKRLILVGSALLSTSVFVILVLIGVICLGFFQIYKKKPRNPDTSSRAVETNLPRFTYQDLVDATDGFKHELGKGAFGIVYKGVIGKSILAVKKLDRVVQDGDKEFQAEVNAIARTHHKNLVQLLGYCDDGEQRLLVYEYMSNGTLADFLFGDMRPSWKQRKCIALGIAKGLSYLHEECSTQIIHCDIKPQNILLDEYYNAKISDFGLAKLLMMNQSRTNTGIRGTKGYVAPEWFRSAPITVKVDVFSFGVVLLEIISCRKCVLLESDREDAAVLTDWAWDCYVDDRLDAFTDNDLEGLDDVKTLTAFVMVGLWCVQESQSLRPTMRTVVQMLEGAVEVTEPPCPCPLYDTTS